MATNNIFQTSTFFSRNLGLILTQPHTEHFKQAKIVEYVKLS